MLHADCIRIVCNVCEYTCDSVHTIFRTIEAARVEADPTYAIRAVCVCNVLFSFYTFFFCKFAVDIFIVNLGQTWLSSIATHF